jgi:NitT/TauT family transport system permease protein/taurine transport system permease protein
MSSIYQNRFSPRTTRLLFVVTLLLCWELLPRFGYIPTLFLPPLSDALMALWGSLSEYLTHLWFSTQAIGLAILIACGAGISLGLLLSTSRALVGIAQQLASSGYAVPIVILYPLFTAWFGIGMHSKVAFASIYGFFPCFLGTLAGVKTIDRHYITIARSLGASRRQLIFRVLLPAAIPTILSAFRVGGSLVIVGVVVAEMLTSAQGVGYLITRYRGSLDSAKVFAGILIVVAVVLIFDQLIRYLERRTGFWRLSTQSSENVGA